MLAHTVFPPNFEYEYNSLGFSDKREAWNFDWNVSFRDFTDLPEDGNSTVQIDLKVIAVTRADMSMGIHGQELISESVPVHLRVLDINDPDSSIALYYYALTGERICDISDLNFTTDGNKTTPDIVSELVKGAVEEDMIDLIGAQVVLYGSYYDDDAVNFYEEWLRVSTRV